MWLKAPSLKEQSNIRHASYGVKDQSETQSSDLYGEDDDGDINRAINGMDSKNKEHANVLGS